MRVLLLSPFAPGANHNHAAADTIVQLVPRLARRTELFVYSPQNTDHRDHLGYTLLAAQAPPRPCRRDRLGVRPAWLRQAWPRRATGEVMRLVERLRPDVVHAEYLQSAEVLARFRRSVLGLHDITERIMAESYRASAGVERPYRLAELLRTRRFERAAIRRAAAVVTLSETDRAVASRLNANTFLARPGVEPGTVAWASPSGPDRPRLVFAGAMWRRANVLVAQHLAGAVMPVVWQRFPTAELRIVGADPAGVVVGLGEQDSRIVVTGVVPDIRDEMLGAHAVVVPSIVGGGVLMKVVHAMALGCPVVTSPGPAESVGGDATMLFVGGTAEELADAIRTVLDSPEEAARRGAHARDHIGRSFRWDDTVRSYLDAYAIASER